jgi:copper chaperone CopZ
MRYFFQSIFKDYQWRKLTMEKQTLSIPNITCGHCVMSIKNELNELTGVTRVVGDPDSKRVTVEWEPPATIEEIKKSLKEMNYPAA